MDSTVGMGHGLRLVFYSLDQPLFEVGDVIIIADVGQGHLS